MKKLCIPPLIKSYGLLIFILSASFYAFESISISSVFIFFIWLIYFVIDLFIVCPKCEKRLHINKHGIYRPPLLYCDKCGHNLMKCDVK